VRTYSLILGLLVLAAAPATAQRRGAARAWEPALGIQGGYYMLYLPGQGGLDGFAAPGVGLGGAGLALAGTVLPTPAGVFAIFPMGQKLALEPSIDIHRIQTGGNTLTLMQLSGRFDLAMKGGWYGAAGLNVMHLTSTGLDAVTVFGANVAWGYRFKLTNNLGGRFEANYMMYPQNDDLQQASNTFGLSFGATMPLK